MATPSSFSRRPSCGACPGRPRTPTSGVRASGQGDGVTQRPPDGVVAEKLECTLVCILTRSLVTVAAAEQGAKYVLKWLKKHQKVPKFNKITLSTLSDPPPQAYPHFQN